jgi:hypothetical protein
MSSFFLVENAVSSLISGFRRDVDEICGLLGYYAAWCDNCLPTFRDNVSVPSSRVKSPSRKVPLSLNENFNALSSSKMLYSISSYKPSPCLLPPLEKPSHNFLILLILFGSCRIVRTEGKFYFNNSQCNINRNLLCLISSYYTFVSYVLPQNHLNFHN